MIKIYESKSECPFDTKNTDMSYYNDIMRDSEKDYYKYDKGIEGEIIYLTPKEYMDICTNEVFNGTDAYSGISKSKVEQYAQKMLDGEIFPMTVLEIQDNYVGQEGRHRMLGAGKAFGKDIKFPVLFVHNANVTRDDAFNYLKKKYGKFMSDEDIEKNFAGYLNDLI